MTALTRQVLQTAWQLEMARHLGYDKHDPVGRNRENSRTGSTPKTVTTEIGKVSVDVPRDRDGTFEPQIVPEHKRRLTGFDDAVISLYGKGMTTGDIAAHLAEVYDTDVSRDLVSAVTGKADRRNARMAKAAYGIAELVPGGHGHNPFERQAGLHDRCYLFRRGCSR